MATVPPTNLTNPSADAAPTPMDVEGMSVPGNEQSNADMTTIGTMAAAGVAMKKTGNGVKRDLDVTSYATVEANASPVKRKQLIGCGNVPEDDIEGSFVVELVGIPPSVPESDISFLLAPFSAEHVLTPLSLTNAQGQRMATIEFSKKSAAEKILKYLSMHSLKLKDSPVPLRASIRGLHGDTKMEGKSPTATPSSRTSSDPPASGRVVLLSVSNMHYPVDIEVLHVICSKWGQVQKIVTFAKSPVVFQALVQFCESSQAMAAMMNLNGRNMYESCNTLQLQPSRLAEITVKQNNTKSWDFTLAPTYTQTATQLAGLQAPFAAATHHPNAVSSQAHMLSSMNPNDRHTCGSTAEPGSSMGGHMGHQRDDSLLPTPYGSSGDMMSATQSHQGHMMQQSGDYQSHSGSAASTGDYFMYSNPAMDWTARMQAAAGHGMMPASAQALAALRPKSPAGFSPVNTSANTNQTAVIIVYNLSADQVDVTKLFNLFSLYGPVERVKLLRAKPDTALIQYSDPLFASMAFTFLQGIPLFQLDAGIQISFSKNSEVKVSSSQFRPDSEYVPDDRTRSFTPRDQRYNVMTDLEKYVRGASKPTATLFIANIHELANESEVRSLFAEFGTVNEVKIRPGKVGSTKRMAFVDMASELEAIRALCNMHNFRLHETLIKVAFSKSNTAPSSR